VASGVFCTGQPGQHPYAVRGYDFYATAPVAVEKLVEADPHLNPSLVKIFEPAAGNGGIAVPLRKRGFPVIASDIVEREFQLHFIADFFALTKAPAGCTHILTNPPYRCAQQFAEHALDLVPDVYLLLRLSFLEGLGRTELLERRGLCAVHVFRARLPRMHRAGWTGPRTTSSIAFAWFHWRRGFRGLPVLNRI
jgi:hypothetical protein